jgi:hypothetical protein
MKNKVILISITGVLALAGFASLYLQNQTITSAYVTVSSILLVSVSIGGLIHYNTQDMRDFREIYREKHAMKMEEIAQLKKEIIRIAGTKNPERISGRAIAGSSN